MTNETGDKPSVSIVMACFNGEKFLAAQLESLLAQTLSPDEILICDDRSTDSTWDILNSATKKHANVSLIRNKQNKGVNTTFFELMLRAKGELIFFCDQDDIWKPDKLKIMTENWKGEGLLFCDASIIDASGRKVHQSEVRYHGMHPNFLSNSQYFLVRNCVSGHNMMVAKALARSCPKPPTLTTYDHWLTLYASLTSSIGFIDNTLCEHRFHNSNAINGVKHRSNRTFQLSKTIERINHAIQQESAALGERANRVQSTFPPGDTQFNKLVTALSKHHNKENDATFCFKCFCYYLFSQLRDHPLNIAALKTAFKISIGRELAKPPCKE